MDPADLEELRCTHSVLGAGLVALALATLKVAVTRPIRFARALAMTLAMHRASHRGLVTHLAYLAEAAYLALHLNARRVDLLHVHFGTNAATMARLARCLAGPPYSVMIHGPAEFDAVYGLSLREKVAEALFVTAISSFCAAQVRRWSAPADWPRIHVVRCTVDASFFAAARPIPRDSQQLVCIGRLTVHKGHASLLEAFARVRAEGVAGQLVIAGDGALRVEVERAIRELGLEKDVVMTGRVNEAQVRELMLASRAVVLASYMEGLPVVLMEALALARPVVTTNVAGIPELVRDGANGFVVAPMDTPALVAALRSALTLPVAQLDAMGARGSVDVRALHSVEREVEKLDALITRYLGTAARAA